jgi:CCR4-NOT transcriptional regulation complex NOT5 subunit
MKTLLRLKNRLKPWEMKEIIKAQRLLMAKRRIINEWETTRQQEAAGVEFDKYYQERIGAV